jgi:hypothetical protein
MHDVRAVPVIQKKWFSDGQQLQLAILAENVRTMHVDLLFAGRHSGDFAQWVRTIVL